MFLLFKSLIHDNPKKSSKHLHEAVDKALQHTQKCPNRHPLLSISHFISPRVLVFHGIPPICQKVGFPSSAFRKQLTSRSSIPPHEWICVYLVLSAIIQYIERSEQGP